MLEALQQYIEGYDCNDYTGCTAQWMSDELKISTMGFEYPVLQLLDKMARKIQLLEEQAAQTIEDQLQCMPPEPEPEPEPEPAIPTQTGTNDHIVIQSLINRVTGLETRLAAIENTMPACGFSGVVKRVGDIDRKSIELTTSVEKISDGAVDLYNALVEQSLQIKDMEEEMAAIRLKNKNSSITKRIVRVKTRGIKDGIHS